MAQKEQLLVKQLLYISPRKIAFVVKEQDPSDPNILRGLSYLYFTFPSLFTYIACVYILMYMLNVLQKVEKETLSLAK